MLNQSQQGKIPPHTKNINKRKRERITMYVQQDFYVKEVVL